MKFLTSHGEKLVCAVVVLLCGAWIFVTLGHDMSGQQRDIKAAQEDIKKALENNQVDATYRYHEDNVPGFADTIKGFISNAEQPLGSVAQEYAFYPKPERPVVEEKKAVTTTTITEVATLSKYTGLSMNAEQGLIALTCQAPAKMPNFVPVRIELQRGTAPDKLDKIIHVFELAPEVGTTGATDTGTATPEVTEDPSVEKSGTTARSARRSTSRSAKGPEPTAKKEPGSASLRFEDVGVESKTTYYYRARLVARMETLGPNNVTFRDGKEITIVVPDDIEKVPGKIEGTVLYASPWSDVVNGTVPSDFQLRFNFVTGTVPSDPRSPQVGYGVFMGVRLWDSEARAWSESSFEVAAGKPIAGKQKFKVGGNTKLREFDTGMVLEAVRPAVKFEVEKVKQFLTVNKTDENGETVPVPVVDETGQPKWVERLVPRRTPTQVAILRVTATDKEIRLIKGQGYDSELPADVKILLEGEPEPVLEQPKDPAAADAKAAPTPDAKSEPEGKTDAAPVPAATSEAPAQP